MPDNEGPCENLELAAKFLSVQCFSMSPFYFQSICIPSGNFLILGQMDVHKIEIYMFIKYEKGNFRSFWLLDMDNLFGVSYKKLDRN